MGREYVEDARRTGRRSDFNCHRRIREALEEWPIASIRTLAEATGYTLSTVFFVLSEVLGLKFRHWGWVPHLLTDDQKVERIRQSILLRTQLQRAAARSGSEFWTGDESWLNWVNPPTRFWMPLDEEIPQRVRQTIGARKSMFTVFFNPNHFAIVDLLPQNTNFTAAYFVARVVIPLANQHHQEARNVARRKLRLHFDNARCHTAATVTAEMVHLRCVRIPHPAYSPDRAICDFWLFGCHKRELQGITIDTEEDPIEQILTILQSIPQSDIRRAFAHWKERCQWVMDNDGEYYPN
jgi:hypothetical protein